MSGNKLDMTNPAEVWEWEWEWEREVGMLTHIFFLALSSAELVI